MMMNSKDEIAFAKQLNDFEASMQSDLQSRTSELSKRWEFDFESEAPTLSKKMSWEPVDGTETLDRINEFHSLFVRTGRQTSLRQVHKHEVATHPTPQRGYDERDI